MVCANRVEPVLMAVQETQELAYGLIKAGAQNMTSPSGMADKDVERRALELVEDVLDLPAAGRDLWLRGRCAGEPALLARATSLLAAGATEGGLSTGNVSFAPASVPEIIGPYRLGEVIGQGGMGSVYRAERIDGGFHQNVAIKLLHSRVDSEALHSFEARFRAEQEILASLSHPNIAQLFDGGSLDDGTPYIVMELVEGIPIDQFVRATSDKETLRVFQRVCEAVQSAHQSLVVHRDIKPSNILVLPDGQPKLLDFGVAKVLSAADSGQLTVNYPAMTPQYASPEQVSGAPITTASDVYSLGVLLYRLVSGDFPYDVTGQSPGELVTMVSTAEPKPLNASIDGVSSTDLRLIIDRALHKDPQQRYTTAQALSDDLQRLIEHRPIQARGDRWSYRLRRFFRRNAILSLAIAVATTAIAVGVATSLSSANQARVEAERSQAVTRYLESVLLSPSSYRLGPIRSRPDVLMSEIVRQAGEDIPTTFADDPETATSLMTSVAMTLLGLGEYAQAEELISKAITLARTDVPSSSSTQLQVRFAYLVIGTFRGTLMDLDGQRSNVSEYLQIAREISGEQSIDYAVGLILDAQFQEDPHDALPLLKEAELIYLAAGGLADEAPMGWRWQAEAMARLRIEPETAQEPAERALAVFTQPDGTIEMLGGTMFELMGFIALNGGRKDDAKENMLKARDVFRDLGIEYQQITPLLMLGGTEARQGNVTVARDYFAQARGIIDGLGWGYGNQMAIDLTSVEMALDTQIGDFAKAVERGERQLSIVHNRKSAEDPIEYMYLYGRYAMALLVIGRDEEAAEMEAASRALIEKYNSGTRRDFDLGVLDEMMARAREVRATK